jgi:uncharacterized protein YjiS (DUF1127 family)
VQSLFTAFAPAASPCRAEATEKTMTMISSAAGQPASLRSPAGLARMLGTLANGVVVYWARREAVKTLRQLDDRALRDIGIARSQIEAAVQGVVDPTFGYVR